MREGAADFLVKPLDLHDLRRVLARVFDDRRARRALQEHSVKEAPRQFIARGPQIIEIYKVVGQAAARRTNVLIRGESGTGKELIARAIHDQSAFASEPFVAVNCSAIPAVTAPCGREGAEARRFSFVRRISILPRSLGDVKAERNRTSDAGGPCGCNGSLQTARSERYASTRGIATTRTAPG